MEKDRPSFSTYRRHVYRRIFGLSLSRKAIVTENGDMYAMEYSFRWKCFYIATLVISLVLLLRFSILSGFAYLCLFPIAVFLGVLHYFLARFYPLDECGDVKGPGSRSRTLKPTLAEFINQRTGAEQVLVHRAIKNDDGQLYLELSGMKTNSVQSSFTNIMLLTWIFAALYFSFGYSVLLLLVYIAIFIIALPLRYYVTPFKKTDRKSKIDDAEDTHKTTATDILLIIGVTLVWAAVFFFGFRFLYQADESATITTDKQISFTQAEQTTQQYMSSQGVDGALLSFQAVFFDEEALQRQPSNLILEYHTRPSGLFYGPNQSFDFYKWSGEKEMSIRHHNPSRIFNMTNAPTRPVDIDHIFSLIETKIGRSLEDIGVSRISITGGVRTKRYEPLLKKNTCEVFIESQLLDDLHYIVDFEAGTVTDAN